MKLKGCGKPFRPSSQFYHWLRALKAEAEATAETMAPLQGAVTPEQRPWSRVLDAIEMMRQQVTS